MLNLEDREWKEFRIGKIFNIKRPAPRNKEDYCEGDVPFVASGAINNGVLKYCSPKDEKLDKGNCITVSPVDGTAFYQPIDFLGRGGAGSSILVLYSDNLNKWIGIFISLVIHQTSQKYSYGHMANKEGIKKDRIMLPVNSDGEPDYKYMEQYIRERELEKQKEYIKYCKAKLEELGKPISIEKLEDKKWESFFLKDVFDKIARGKRLKKDDHIEGEKPYVSATSMNNGVDQFIGNVDKIRTYKDCLSLANSGSVGSCFYEPFEFIASDHVTHLKKDDTSKYTYLFLATMITRLSEKYNFNREINDERISREKVYLPVAESGKPDYEYMEQYMKNVMIEKYESYINYCNF